MSEVKTRSSAPRGRGSTRGGRGGPSNRGRGGRANSAKADSIENFSYEQEGEIGELKNRFHSQISTIKELFPDWTDEDIAFALEETDGDLESTIERITEGNVSQWGEVKKKTKDRASSKAPKEVAASASDTNSLATKGTRGRGGSDNVRGGRGRGSDRGSDRGRGGTRGGRGARGTSQPRLNGVVSNNKASKDPASGDKVTGNSDTATADTDSNTLDSSWENVTADQAQQAEPKPTAKEAPKTWASMFAKPKSAPPPKAPKSAPGQDQSVETSTATAAALNTGNSVVPQNVIQESAEVPVTPPTSDLATSEQAVEITPPKDDLTEENLEKIPDPTDGAHVTGTAASTVASTIDHRVISGTPLAPGQQKLDRPPLGGYATTAYKATGMPGRTASYQRKVMEQQEAVVMPGKQAMDKTAVQFGSMGLNGASDDVDVDSDREDAETRAQPPQHSPVAPRASLPPAPEQRQGLPAVQPLEPQQAPRPAPGLPPVSHNSLSQQPPLASAPDAQPSAHAGYPYGGYGDRFTQPSSQPEVSAPPQKPHEPFGQQLQQPHYDAFGTGYGGGSSYGRQEQDSKSNSGAGNMSSYYSADEQRQAYSAYGGYGITAQSGPEPAASQQRTSSSIGSSAPNQATQHATAPGRYGAAADAQGSGHSTPYGSMPTPQSHGSGPGQQHGGYGGYGGYPYGYSSYYGMGQMGGHNYGRDRPTFDETRRYEDSYGGFGYGGHGGYGGGNYGGAGGKGMYGQHPSYGVSNQTSQDQSTGTPANASAFGQQGPSSGRDSAVGGLSSYGPRSGSTQPSDNIHSGAQNNASDVYGRAGSNFGGNQNQGLGGSGEESARGFNESKVPGGPSPALGQASNRPGSAINPQTGLPPQDARFSQGYGGYPSHSQYGAGPSGQHGSGGQNQAYGAYGGGYGGYYGNNNRGWGASYGH